MSDLLNQIHAHYAAHSLSPEKVTEILKQGRAAGSGEGGAAAPVQTTAPERRRQFLALAAALAILAGLGAFWFAVSGRADYAALRPAVIAFLADKPTYPLMSKHPEKLRTWVIERGAPPTFQIPPKLQVLASKGCAILTVDEKPAYLLCFFTEDANGRRDGGMVHLLVAQKRDFRNVPNAGDRSIHTSGRWSFISWRESDIVYTVATPGSVKELRRYLASVVDASPQDAT
ncbi:hypothetical protein BH20VER3_BH20VER3_07530 [soil metagenome]